MKTFSNQIRRKMALITGLSLLLMAVCAGVSYGYAFAGFHVKGDAALTLQHLEAKPSLMNIFLGGFAMVLLLDLVVSVSLYLFYRQAASQQSKLLAATRVGYSVLLGIAIMELVFAKLEAGSASPSAEVLLSHLDAFLARWSMALVVFGIHLMLWGWMALRSGETPKFLGALAMFAGLCYFGHHALNSWVAEYQQIGPMVEKVLALPMALGELFLAIWMIARGGRERSVSALVQSAS